MKLLENTAILEAITERDMDLLLLEEFHVSEPFRLWFAGKVLDEEARGLRFVNAWHSITDGSLGESDLLVLFANPDDRVSAILVENKVDAPLQPDQAQRYAERGHAGVQRGDWHRFKTVIVAPSGYLARGGDTAKFDAQLSYEMIKDWFDHHLSEVRAAYRSKVLQMAIKQSRRGPPARIDERVTKFYRDYWGCARREFPELAMKEPTEKRAGSNWAGFHPKDLGKDRWIWHKMDIGRVDLEIKGAAASVDHLRAKYGLYLASDTTIEKAGKSAAIRIPVPVLDMFAPFEEQTDKARAGMRAAYRLYYQARAIGGA